MQIAVIGTGYVGLVSGACFADLGHSVVCVDVDAGKVERLRSGEMPIYEPGLEELVERNARAGRLDFTTDMAAAMREADAAFIAVGTPSREGDGAADLTAFYAAVRDAAAHGDGFTVIVNKSTVPVGTGDEVEAMLGGLARAGEIAVVSNPEFLREGNAIEDFKHPDRVVVGLPKDGEGALDERARRVMAELYRPLSQNGTRVMFTGRRTAELIKYASNAFLATKIAFINEIADLCEATGADVLEVSWGMGLDQRIGSRFLQAGPGYGGSCFPKDTLALARTAAEAGAPLGIVERVIAGNSERKEAMADRVIAACGGHVAGRTIAVLGLTFKPGTDDMREAPSLAILPKLVRAGAKVRAYDPEGMDEAARHLRGIERAESAEACITGADALVVLTEWDEFRALDLDDVAQWLAEPVLVDLRNIYDPRKAGAAGLRYHGVGRGAGNGIGMHA